MFLPKLCCLFKHVCQLFEIFKQNQKEIYVDMSAASAKYIMSVSEKFLIIFSPLVSEPFKYSEASMHVS